MIASTVLVLSAGRFSDLFGRKRAYIAGFVVLAAASLGAGFAGSGTELIIWRVVQGIGGALLFANAPAIVTDAFPSHQLGVAMGTNTMIAAVGLVLGPVLGGALVAIAWPWVFWFNVPLSIAGAVWAALVLHERGRRDTERGLDLLGALTFLIGLTGFVFAISRGGLSGWNDLLVIAGFAAALVLLPLFVVMEAHQRAPMLDLTMFRNRLFSAAVRGGVPQRSVPICPAVRVRLLLSGTGGRQRVRRRGEAHPMAVGMLIASPLAGAAADRHGSRGLATAGMVVTAAGLALMTTLGVASPYWQTGLWLFAVGVGSGMFNSPNTAAMMGSVPPQHPRRRGRRADPDHELRRGHLDRVRPRHRHRGGADPRALCHLLRTRQRALGSSARAVHHQHASGALDPGRDLAAGRRSLRAPAGTEQNRRQHPGRSWSLT